MSEKDRVSNHLPTDFSEDAIRNRYSEIQKTPNHLDISRIPEFQSEKEYSESKNSGHKQIHFDIDTYDGTKERDRLTIRSKKKSTRNYTRKKQKKIYTSKKCKKSKIVSELLPSQKLSNEQVGLSQTLSLSLQYTKNVVIFLVLIFGNQNTPGNLLIVSQFQMMYSLWLLFSLLKVKSSNIGFIFQEMFFNVYILTIIYYYFNFSESREWAVIVMYFMGLSVSVFFVVFELVFIFVIRPLRKLIGRPVPE